MGLFRKEYRRLKGKETCKRIEEGDLLKIDQSTLIRESLPVTKKSGDKIFTFLACKQGKIEAIVIATGVQTFFGKASHHVDNTNKVGQFPEGSHRYWEFLHLLYYCWNIG